MQKLQQILQRAIAEKCDLVDITSQAAVSVWQGGAQTFWPDFGTIGSQDIDAFQKMLFPKGINGAAAKGQVEIPNFGILLTIGTVQPTYRLLVFLPAGHGMVEAAWQELNAPVTQAPPPPPPTPMPASIPLAPLAATSAPDLPPLPSSAKPVATPAGKPLVAGDQIPLGAILPADIFAAPQPAKKKAAEKKTASKGESAPLSSPPEELPASLFAPKDTPRPPAPKHTAAPLSLEQDAPAPEFQLLSVRQVETPVQEEPASFEPATGSVQFGSTSIGDLKQGEAPLAPSLFNATANTHAPGKLSATISGGPKDIDRYLNAMLERKASDLHITAGEPIAFRIDGDMVRVPEWVLSEADVSALLDPITSPFSKHQFESENDADLAYEIPDVARFRVNLFRDRHGRGAVLRHIPSKIPSFEDLGLPETLKKLCYLNKGLVVVTGPTGSGKSTTLAAMVDYINQHRKDHLLTLEDPIEFVHKQKNCLIRQREIFKHTNSFARALKAALREDPDIILVGELRDLETTALAIEIAETGHLVLATLHTSTAASTIDRIIDQFSADRQEQIRTMLAESLKGVVAQTLLKRASGGRVAAQEVLMVNAAVSAMIREGKIHMLQSHMQSQKGDGNILLNEALATLVQKKIVLPKDAWLKAIDKNNLIDRFKQAGIDISWLNTINAA